MVLKPEREEEARRIFEKWGLDAAVIGRTTDTNRLVLRWHGDVVCDLPLGPLADEAPLYERPFVRPHRSFPSPLVGEGGSRASENRVRGGGANAEGNSPNTPHPSASRPPSPTRGEGVDFPATLAKIMASPDMCSKRWIWSQYDRHVMADTVDDSGAGADAAIVRLHGSNRALAMTSDVTPRYVEADPYEGGKQAVAEAWRNLTASGATPLAITDNLNFGNPQKPEIMGSIVSAIEGMAEACRALAFPVISGNVSLYNETNGVAILPTPTVGAVGLIADVSKRASIGALAEGDLLLQIGAQSGWLGQTIYLREMLGREEGAPPPVDLEAEKRNGDFVRELIETGLVRACHDISDGGLACAAAEMALEADLGIALGWRGDLGDVEFLYGEDQARYLVAASAEIASLIEQKAKAAHVECLVVGEIGGRDMTFLGASGVTERLALSELRTAHEGWLPAYMGEAM